MEQAGRSWTGVLGPAIRLVRRRVRADPVVLSAALVTVVMASTIVAAGPVYSAAVTGSALRRTLEQAPARTAGVQVSASLVPARYAATDHAVTSALSGALAGTDPTVYRSALSQTYELPGQPADKVTRLAVFGFADRITEEGELVAGSWPTGGSAEGPVASAVNEQVATALRLRVGSTLQLRARLDGRRVEVRVVAVYRVRDPSSVMWWESPLETRGVEVHTFTNYGPFITSERVFHERLAARGASAYWRSAPNPRAVRVGAIGLLAGRVAALDTVLDTAAPDGNLTVASGLPALLGPADRALLVTRGAMLVPTAQLAVLAAYALLLSAGLMLETRHVETALLRARGATAGQVAVIAALEAALIVVPATILGPVLAVLAVGAVDRVGPIAGIGYQLQPRLSTASFLLAGLAAALCSTALIVPAVLRARTFAAARRERGRQQLRALVAHIRLDLVLAALAVLLLWQLRRYGSGLTQTTGGGLGIDPLLVGAPAVGLLAGALVALRVVPTLAQWADRWATAQPGMTAPLGAWQLARRPARYTRPVLLLVLALAIGLFAIAYIDTWRASQRDQAEFAVGADVRVVHGTSTAGPPIDVPGGHEAIAGVRRSMPVVRDRVNVTPVETADLLAMGVGELPAVLRLRDDLSPGGAAGLARGLDGARALPPAVELPGRTRRLRLDLTAEPAGIGAPPVTAVAVVVRDAGGVLYRLPTALQSGWRAVTVTSGAARYPLSLAAIEIRLSAPEGGAEQMSLAVTVQASEAGAGWRDVDTGRTAWRGSADELGSVAEQPSVVHVTGITGGPLRTTLNTGGGAPPGEQPVFRLAPAGGAPGVPLAAAVTERVLELTQRRIGDVVSMDIGGGRRDVRLAGLMRAVPTLPGNGAAMVVDLAHLSAVTYAENGTVLRPAEWWLATDDGAVSDVAVALAAAPAAPGSEVLDRVGEGRRLGGDVVAVGIVGGLAIALVAAALFAAVGFAVSVAVAVRQRLSELALLRAIGLSPRQVGAALAVEQTLVVTVSLVGGTLLGLALTHVVVPAFVLTRAGAAAVPAVRVVIPWRAVAAIEVGIVAGAVVIVALAGVALRGLRVGALLRLGSDT